MLRRLFLLILVTAVVSHVSLGAGRRSDAFRDHHDPSGAVIPFAMVSLRDTETALSKCTGIGGPVHRAESQTFYL